MEKYKQTTMQLNQRTLHNLLAAESIRLLWAPQKVQQEVLHGAFDYSFTLDMQAESDAVKAPETLISELYFSVTWNIHD